MKQRLISIIGLLLVFFSSYAQQEKRAYEYLNSRNEVYFRIFVSDKAMVKELSKLVSIDKISDNDIIAYANSGGFSRFLETGLDYEVLTPPSFLSEKAISMATTIGEMQSWDRYPTYEVYVQMMEKFASDFPEICQLIEIGTTVEGRKLLAVKLSDHVGQNETEPEFFYSSTMHGDETLGFVLYLRLIDYLLNHYGLDQRITTLLDNVELFINPNANPDGTYAYGNSTVLNSTRSNANGIDLNRSFPDIETGAYSQQPEVKHMMEFAEKNHFVFSANTHGGAELVNYPWDKYVRRHADDAWFFYVSKMYAQQAQNDAGNNGYLDDFVNGAVFPGVTNGFDWYIAQGSRQDYMTYYQNCREITLELSSAKLLGSEKLPAYWNYNKEASLLWIEQVLYGIHGTVSDEQGNPVYAKICIDGHDIEADRSIVYTDKEMGDFHRMIEPGSYTLTISADGYEIKEVAVTLSSYQETVTEHVVLKKLPSYTLSGYVKSFENQAAIRGAKVEILAYENWADSTDDNGYFELNGLWENTFSVRISKNSYKTHIQEITISGQDLQQNFELKINNAESFENGLSEDWILSGNKEFFIDNTNSYDGDFSLASGTISHNQHSSVQIEKSVYTGSLSFYMKVSSESGYDFVYFYIDGEEIGKWSGEINWKEYVFNVEEGDHVFEWKYVKDGYESQGADRIWIDNVHLPLKPEIETLNATEITVNSGVLTANFTPNSNLVTSFVFEFGTTESFGSEIHADISDIAFYNKNLIQASVADLEEGKTYYFRARAQLGEAIVYGETQSFKTLLTGIEPEFQSVFTVYPNPVKDYLNIELLDPEYENAVIQIINVEGKVVRSDSFNGDTFKTIYLGGLAKGIYFIEVKTCSCNQSIRLKIIKE